MNSVLVVLVGCMVVRGCNVWLIVMLWWLVLVGLVFGWWKCWFVVVLVRFFCLILMMFV